MQIPQIYIMVENAFATWGKLFPVVLFYARNSFGYISFSKIGILHEWLLYNFSKHFVIYDTLDFIENIAIVVQKIIY